MDTRELRGQPHAGGWRGLPVWSILAPVKRQGHPKELVLSVYREHGVIPKSSRDDNHNRTPDNLDAYQLVEPGDVVFNKMKAWSGSVGVASHRGIVSPDYMVCQVLSQDIDRQFLHYLLRSHALFSEYRRRSKGIRPSQWRLYFDELRSVELSLPPLDTQRRIADMLDVETARIDTLIEKKQAAVEAARARLDRLRWDLVVGVRLPDARRPAALGWSDTVPESWPVVSLQYLLRSKYGFPFQSEGFSPEPASTPVVRIRDVVPNRVQTWTEEHPVGDVWLEDGDIVIGMDGDFNHVRWTGGRGALNQRVCSVRSSSAALTDDFLMDVLGYPLRYINDTVHFTTVKHLSFADLLSQKVPVPPPSEQSTVVGELRREREVTDRLMDRARMSIELLRLRRQALITAAVTGEIDV